MQSPDEVKVPLSADEISAMRGRCEAATPMSMRWVAYSLEIDRAQDAAFVKHARVDLPRCLDEIERQRGELEHSAACLTGCHGTLKVLEQHRAEALAKVDEAAASTAAAALKVLDDWCYENLDCNLVAAMEATSTSQQYEAALSLVRRMRDVLVRPAGAAAALFGEIERLGGELAQARELLVVAKREAAQAKAWLESHHHERDTARADAAALREASEALCAALNPLLERDWTQIGYLRGRTRLALSSPNPGASLLEELTTLRALAEKASKVRLCKDGLFVVDSDRLREMFQALAEVRAKFPPKEAPE